MDSVGSPAGCVTSFGPVARQVQLDLIYAYSMSGDAKKALASIDRFIKLNPNHPDLDYVYYMRGLTNLQQDQNLAQDRQQRSSFRPPNFRPRGNVQGRLQTARQRLQPLEPVPGQDLSLPGTGKLPAHLCHVRRAPEELVVGSQVPDTW